MNDHRKLVQDCINKRSDNHAKLLKKLDKTCERIAKNEPKQEWKYINEFGFANTFTGRWK